MGGTDPPAVAYLYAPGRGAEHAVRHLAGFSGTLQVDGYVAYDALTDAKRAGGPLLEWNNRELPRHPHVERMCRKRLASRGEITPPCGVPATGGTMLPFSICTGAFNQRST